MSRLGTIAMKGMSGKKYVFRAYSMDTIFEEGLGGVYVLTKRTLNEATQKQRHKPLIMGHNDNLHQPNINTSDSHYGDANCICVLAEKDESTRLGIHQDLVSTGS